MNALFNEIMGSKRSFGEVADKIPVRGRGMYEDDVKMIVH